VLHLSVEHNAYKTLHRVLKGVGNLGFPTLKKNKKIKKIKNKNKNKNFPPTKLQLQEILSNKFLTYSLLPRNNPYESLLHYCYHYFN